jgi:hypothetical protein
MRLSFWAKVLLLSVAACILCIGLLWGPPHFTTSSVAQRWGDPILDLETVQTVEEVRLILSDAPSQDRETMRLKTQIDFAFVASYVALLVTLGVGMARHGGWRRMLGVTAAICGLAAGVFDVFENLAILDILDVKIAATTEQMLAAIRQPSTVKWSLAAISVVLLLSHYESTVRSAVSRTLRRGQGRAR